MPSEFWGSWKEIRMSAGDMYSLTEFLPFDYIISRLIILSYWSLQAIIGYLFQWQSEHINSIFLFLYFFFQVENRDILLWLEYIWIRVLSILDFIFCRVLCHCKMTVSINLRLRPLMRVKVKNFHIMLSYLINILELMNLALFIV